MFISQRQNKFQASVTTAFKISLV